MGNILSKLFKKEYTNISTEELNLMLKNQYKYQFIDVRTKREFASNKISQISFIVSWGSDGLLGR